MQALIQAAPGSGIAEGLQCLYEIHIKYCLRICNFCTTAITLCIANACIMVPTPFVACQCRFRPRPSTTMNGKLKTLLEVSLLC